MKMKKNRILHLNRIGNLVFGLLQQLFCRISSGETLLGDPETHHQVDWKQTNQKMANNQRQMDDQWLMGGNLQMPGSCPVSFWYSPTFFFKLLNVIIVNNTV